MLPSPKPVWTYGVFRLRKHAALGAVLLAALSALAMTLRAASDEPQIGQPAPEFTAVDSHGKTRDLAGFRGTMLARQHGVMWLSAECAFLGAPQSGLCRRRGGRRGILLNVDYR